VRNWITTFVIIGFMLLSGIARADDERPYAFELVSTDGDLVQAPLGEPATVVCFLGAECPLARLYAPKLAKLAAEYESQGVQFIGVSSNQHDSLDDMRRYAETYRLPFPIVKDYDNLVADHYKADRTPEVFLIDALQVLQYRGRIDDQYHPGLAREQATREDLRIALDEVLAGKIVSVSETEAAGCLIGRIKRPVVNPSVTYARNVSRVLQRNCVECHREGEIGPFALTEYDEVVGWADMMLETIDDGRMPPWHANPAYGHFANARVMPEADKQVLRDWVAAGAPLGDIADLPEPTQYVSGWNLDREPDLVLEMRDHPYRVPAEGTVEYQYFVVDPGFTEDKWVIGAQAIPGNPSVVHHVIVFFRPPDGEEFRGIGWITAYVPGQRSTMLPPGMARRIPAGSTLVFQMHYTTNGVEQDDLTKVGLLFGDDDAITHEVSTRIGINHEFEIPPGAGDFPVSASARYLPAEGQLLAFAPHMHVRGKSFRLFARCGKEETVLLDIPHYDFNWQHVYELAEPIDLATIDDLHFTARFDNSGSNPVNPDPAQHVTWGDQTWEEMAIAFFEVAEPRDRVRGRSNPSVADTPERQRAIAGFVDDYLKRFDKDHSGTVDYDEVPIGLQHFGFHQFDSDGDKKLTREELEHAATTRSKVPAARRD